MTTPRMAAGRWRTSAIDHMRGWLSAQRGPGRFIVAALGGWLLAYMAGVAVGSALLGQPLASTPSQIVGRITATVLVVAAAARLGWLRGSGLSRAGSMRTWLITGALLAYVGAAYWWAFFVRPAEPAMTLWPGSSGVPILMDQGAAGLDAFADAVATTRHLSAESPPPPQE